MYVYVCELLLHPALPEPVQDEVGAALHGGGIHADVGRPGGDEGARLAGGEHHGGGGGHLDR